MSISWDNIKYIFQIPIEWYRKISNRVFNAYGTNFLTINEGLYGGMELGIDENAFTNMIEDSIESILSGGIVKSVDGVTPDENGDVELSAVKSVNNISPDATGNVDISSVNSVDGIQADANGNVELSAVRYVDGIAPDSNGNVELSAVTAVDGIAPDEYGNVELSAIRTVNNISPDANGNVDISSVNSVDGIFPDSTGNVELSVVKTVNGQAPDANGNVFVGVGIVKSVDHHSPDTDGNIQLNVVRFINGHTPNMLGEISGVCTSVNGVKADINGNISVSLGEGRVNSVNNIGPDQFGNVDIGNIVYSVEGTTPTNGNVQLTSVVKSVNDIYPVNGNVTLDISSISMDDVEEYVEEQNFATETYVQDQLADYVDTNTLNTTLDDYAQLEDIEGMVTEVDGILPINGSIDFGFSGSKWMKTNATGHLATTDEVPIALSSDANGYLYANNGSLQFKRDQYVDLSTAQTVSGNKTWENQAAFHDSVLFVNTNSPLGGNGTSINHSSITMVGGQMAFIMMGLTSDEDTATISKVQNNGITIADEAGVTIDADANAARLENQPTDLNISSHAIATCGFTALHFARASHTHPYVATVNGVGPDGNGNVIAGTVRSVNGVGPDGNGNVNAGTVKYVNGQWPDSGGNVDVGTVKYVNGHWPDSGGNVEIDAVESVDGHTPSNGAISFGLNGNQWVKTDANGHLATTGETPIALPSGVTGQTTNVSIVTGVTWNGTQLVIAHKQLNFTNGCLTGVTSQNNTTINTVSFST